MTAWLRGLALYVMLIVVALLLEELLGSHPPIDRRYLERAWNGLLAYWPIIAGVILVGLVGFIRFDPRTKKVSDFLTVAENDLNLLLRSWGGGLSEATRRDIARERAEWLSIVDPSSEKRDLFFDLSQKDLEGGGQAAAGAKARMTAFLLREVYHGRVETAQSTIIAATKESKDGKPPYVAPGLRELLGMDNFERYGVFSAPVYSPRRIRLAANLFGHPREIRMVKINPDGKRYEVFNRDVIEELTRQTA
jgi:hypothetical protein